jgi:pyruvate/2-oxoacid:ferredoxin oxidoreductase beta subunit
MMPDNFVLGNMAWNAALVAVVAYFVRGWIKSTEKKTDDNAQEVKTVAKELARVTADSAADIKSDLKEHRTENINSTDEIKRSIDKVFEQVREANGRTTKNELSIALQVQKCEDRTRGNRKDDCTL